MSRGRWLLSGLRALRFISSHPLNRGRLREALTTFVRWQIGSRLVCGSVAVPFVEGTRLLVRPGMSGATGNIYCGLQEFAEMSLVMHALRDDDVFVDVGANIGAYTVLAAGVCGCYVYAVEPVPATFRHLVDNVRLNDIDVHVCARNIGLGAAAGTLTFSATLDTANHVLDDPQVSGPGAVSAHVDTLDALLDGRAPTLMKIDVEGYEAEVLRGATQALQSRDLLAVVMELNGSGARYGVDDNELHADMVRRGLEPCAYDPMRRALVRVTTPNAQSPNVIYVKDMVGLSERVRAATPRRVHGRLI